MRACSNIVLLIALTTVATILLGCTHPDGPQAQAPFVCTPEECPKGSCRLTIEFDDICAGLIPRAEIVLNDALEPDVATDSTTFVSTGEVPFGSTGEFWVRSEIWEWKCVDGNGCTIGGPLAFACIDTKKDGYFKLACTSNATGSLSEGVAE